MSHLRAGFSSSLASLSLLIQLEGEDFMCTVLAVSYTLHWIRAMLLFWHSSHEMQMKIFIYPVPLHNLNSLQSSPLKNSSRKGSDCFINNNRKKPLELTRKIQIMLHLQVTHSRSLIPTTLKPRQVQNVRQDIFWFGSSSIIRDILQMLYIYTHTENDVLVLTSK